MVQLADIEASLERVHGDVLPLRDGEVASYIPELAKVDPELLALAVCTTGGEVASTGDDRHELTLQSLSKPFVYGRALELLGPEAVRRRLGVEPSGDSFDAIIRLDGKNRPHNPMINAGAIAASGLLVEGGEGIAELLATMSRHAGRTLAGVDAPVYLSERTAGHRNRAIAHLMHHLHMLRAPVDRTLEITRNVLSVMLTCGLHDESGRFAFDAGLPAKTGISGGIVAVVPGRMGLAVYSPAVNDHSLWPPFAVKLQARKPQPSG